MCLQVYQINFKEVLIAVRTFSSNANICLWPIGIIGTDVAQAAQQTASFIVPILSLFLFVRAQGILHHS
jgi:hypothetical protein